jgi:hypothetical protein
MDIRPILFILVFPLAALIAAGLKMFYPARSFKKTLLVVVPTLIGLYAFLLHGPFIDVRECRSYEMTWELGEAAKEWPLETHVILRFVRYPDHFQGFYSAELADHLRRRGEKTLVVEFETRSDYGKVRGYHETRIGDFKSTRAPAFSYGGSRGGHEGASPWK